MNADEISVYKKCTEEGWDTVTFTPTQRLCQRQIYFHAQTIMFLKNTKCIWK